MRTSSLPIALAATAISLVAATGCHSQDRAGGTAGADTVVLSFAQPNSEPDDALTLWAEKVDEESNGTVKVEFENGYRAGEAEHEKDTVLDVAAGKVDAGWVGARVFDQMGVTSFQPLLAPMLVDSQSLQGEVFEAGIPAEMLEGLDAIDVHGIGVLPGPMRRVLSKGDPLTTPAAFQGLNVGSAYSAITEQTYAALGATTTPMPSGADISGVDAMEAQMGSIDGNHYEEKGGTSVVGNFNLWPRPLVLFINQGMWAKLSKSQQRILTDSAAEVLPSALDAASEDDTGSTEAECTYGLAMPQATPAELADFRDAFQPVYDAIAEDSQNETWLAQIGDLKTQLGEGPDAATCGSVASPSVGSDALPDGTYLSEREGEIGCLDFEPTNFKLVLAGGVASTYVDDSTTAGFELGAKATYRVFKNRLELRDPESVTTADFTFDGTTLTLSNVEGGGCDGEAVLSGGPWTLQDQ